MAGFRGARPSKQTLQKNYLRWSIRGLLIFKTLLVWRAVKNLNYLKITMKFEVGVIGLGYVGLPLALLAEKKGHRVVGFDIDEEKLNLLKRGVNPLSETKEQKTLSTEITFTSDKSILSQVKIFVVCVPTPVDHDKNPDLGPVENACKIIASILKKDDLVVIESTINPGVCEEVVIPILENGSGLIAGTDFFLAHCPERINPGDDKWQVANIPRVVGGINPTSTKKVVGFYHSLLDAEIMEMNSLKEAEAVKITENAFRDVNIAFVNELAQSYQRMGIDTLNVIKGANTKPFAFMAHYPGCGVGGHCIPVDPYYLIRYAEKYGFTHNLLKQARQVNENMPQYTVELLAERLKTRKPEGLLQTEIAVLGVAYKANIGDYRESPALTIIELLKGQGANVRVCDPYIPKISTSSNLDECLAGAEGCIIACDHDDFKLLTPDFFEEKGVWALVDGKNILDKEAFQNHSIAYTGIGR